MTVLIPFLYRSSIPLILQYVIHSIAKIVTAFEYCTSFTDINKKLVTGFACPRAIDKNDEIYCCGRYDNKYCCNTRGNYTDQENWSPIFLWMFVGLTILLMIATTLMICMFCKNCYIAQLVKRKMEEPDNNQRCAIDEPTNRNILPPIPSGVAKENSFLRETRLGYL